MELSDVRREKSKIFFNELTGIRAIAAYMVFLHHYNFFFSEQRFGSFIHSFVGEFHVGVTIFFVLSGFLICYRYYDDIKLKNKKWIVNYIQNRVARIYPIYFLATTATFAMIFIHSSHLNIAGLNFPIVPYGGQGISVHHDIILYILNITFLRGFFDGIHFTGAGQGWSLTVEECFYICAPFIFYFSKKVKLIIPLLVIFFTGLLLWFIFKNINFYGFFGNLRFELYFTFFGRCFEFFVGIKLALIFKNKYEDRVSKFNYKTLIGTLYIAICISIMALIKGDKDFSSETLGGIAINNFVLPIGIAILFLGLITETTYISRILKSKIFVLLGKSSYSFYLIHVAIINLVVAKITHSTLIIFLITTIVSIIVFKFIEEPCNKYIRKLDVYAFLRKVKGRFTKRAVVL